MSQSSSKQWPAACHIFSYRNADSSQSLLRHTGGNFAVKQRVYLTAEELKSLKANLQWSFTTARTGKVTQKKLKVKNKQLIISVRFVVWTWTSAFGDKPVGVSEAFSSTLTKSQSMDLQEGSYQHATG